MKVGMIGLGGMGKPIAECIVRKGFSLTVNDVRQEQVDALVSKGAESANTPAEVASASDIVIASLPSNAASEEVALDAKGVLAGAKQGDIFIDASTISPGLIRRVHNEAAQKGVGVLDAPVSGGIEQRRDGTLTVMVGGDAATFERAKPLLQAFASNVFHVGEIGSGATVKLINNMLLATNTSALMEGLLLGVKAGLKPEIIRDVLSVSSGASRASSTLMDRILYEPTKPPAGTGPSQGLQTLSKDVRLASELAQSLSVPLMVCSAATQAWLASDAKGLQQHEMWALIEIYEELTGVRLSRPKN